VPTRLLQFRTPPNHESSKPPDRPADDPFAHGSGPCAGAGKGRTRQAAGKPPPDAAVPAAGATADAAIAAVLPTAPAKPAAPLVSAAPSGAAANPAETLLPAATASAAPEPTTSASPPPGPAETPDTKTEPAATDNPTSSHTASFGRRSSPFPSAAVPDTGQTVHPPDAGQRRKQYHAPHSRNSTGATTGNCEAPRQFSR